MRLLLDTHAFIWLVEGDVRLSAYARSLIENAENDLLLSKVSLWEMAIKYSIDKLTFNLPFNQFIQGQLSLNEFQLLDIRLEHIEQVANLPLHHRDPFDRLLISQAIVEDITLISSDPVFAQYAVDLAW
jgi:PIN domain nuclease of toxin-antitoxin system